MKKDKQPDSLRLLTGEVSSATCSIALSLCVSAAALAGCGSVDGARQAANAAAAVTAGATDTSRSSIELVREFTPQQLDELAAKARIAPIAGPAVCSVVVYRLRYDTRGGRGEAVTSSAAVLLPRGPAAACGGPRPLVGYARGTAFVRETDMARLELGEADAVAAATIFAAQGYALVALNYVGYAGSSASYHPYYELTSQAGDMIHAIRAARAQTAALGLVEDGRLFLTGYSQGGAVVLATQRAIEQQPAGQRLRLTAVASSAGATMIGDMAQRVFAGQPSIGATGFLPLLVSSYQQSYGGIYERAADVYAAPFEAIAQPGRLPGEQGYPQLLASGQLPQALFDRGDGKPFLVNPAFQRAFNADPQNPFRQALVRNNLNGWTPKAPLQLCHGRQDALVTFDNTKTVYDDFKARGSAAVRLIDLEGLPAFVAALDVASRDAPRAARYHFVGMPFCQAEARAYFEQFR